MLIKILIIAVAAYISFEITEHLIIPLIGKIFWKGKRPLTGPEAMIGKAGRVREWCGNGGKVDVEAEIWNAVSDLSLSPGDEVIVVGIQGLILRVDLSQRSNQTHQGKILTPSPNQITDKKYKRI